MLDAVLAAQGFAAEFEKDSPVFRFLDFLHARPAFVTARRPAVNAKAQRGGAAKMNALISLRFRVLAVKSG